MGVLYPHLQFLLLRLQSLPLCPWVHTLSTPPTPLMFCPPLQGWSVWEWLTQLYIEDRRGGVQLRLAADANCYPLPHRIEALQATFSVCAYGIWLVSAQGPRARGQYTMAGGLLGGEAVGYTHRPLGFAQCLPGQAHDSNGLHRELCLYGIYLFYLNEFQYCCSYI